MSAYTIPTLIDTLTTLVNLPYVKPHFTDTRMEVFSPYDKGLEIIELFCIYKNNICKAKVQLIASPKSYEGIKEYSICVSSPKFGLLVFKLNYRIEEDVWCMNNYEVELFFDRVDLDNRIIQVLNDKNNRYDKIIADITPKIKTEAEIYNFSHDIINELVKDSTKVIKVY